MRGKLIYPGGWVTVRPMMNKQLPTPDPRCRLCRRASCAPAWYHVSSTTVVCKRCLKDPYVNGESVARELGLAWQHPWGITLA